MLFSEDIMAASMPSEKAWEDSFRKFMAGGDIACLEEKPQASHCIMSQILNQSPVGVIVVTSNDSVALINRVASALFGYDRDSKPEILWDELRSMKRLFNSESESLSNENDPIKAAIQSKKRIVCNILMKPHDDDYESWLTVTAFPVLDPSSGEVIAGAAMIVDITDFKGMQEILYHQATHDSLTGLSNKAFLSAGMYKAFARVKREQTCGAILFLDVDKFKRVNDSLGHAAGDDLLVKVADRIVSEVRETDIVARVGGDEFVVLLADIDKGEDLKVASDVAERICRSVSRPFVIWGNEVYVTISIGISLYPTHGMDENTLLYRADEAMYHVKENGRNGWRFWGSIYD